MKTNGYLVLSAVLALEEGDQEAIKARMKELTEQRVSKQPLEYPSAGSTFKRPEGYFAGKLIMDAGLRGYQTGGAQVAEKHCEVPVLAAAFLEVVPQAVIAEVSSAVAMNRAAILRPFCVCNIKKILSDIEVQVLSNLSDDSLQ